MASTPDTILFTGPNEQQVTAGSVLITSTGGTQVALADALLGKGQTASSLFGVFGATPVAQPSGPQQAALTRGVAGGSVAVINSSTLSPAAVGTLTAAEVGLTLMGGNGPTWNIATGDMLIINKVVAQAGLGIGNVRISAAGVAGVTFSNFTTATVTPTANQSYGFVALRGFGNISGTLSPAAVAPTSITEQTFAVAGLQAGATNLVQVSKPTAQAGLDIVGCRVVSNGTLGITFANPTAATITPTASEVYTIINLAGGMDALNNTMLIEETLSLTASANTVNSASQGAAVKGVAASDAVLGVTKPTAQANFGIVGAFISAAGTLGITISNFAAATVTPTASDVYGIGIYRPAPVAPLVIVSSALAPVSVAANTTAEQTFTGGNLANIVGGSIVWVNKPSATSGLGIVGCRCSTTGTLAVTYANVTTQAIVPPAESYVVGNFQVPLGDAGSEWVQSAVLSWQNNVTLTQAIRSALLSEGLIAGA